MAKATTALEQKLFRALESISHYMTPAQARRQCKNTGLGPDEMIEMAYENVVQTAKQAIRGVKLSSGL